MAPLQQVVWAPLGHGGAVAKSGMWWAPGFLWVFVVLVTRGQAGDVDVLCQGGTTGLGHITGIADESKGPPNEQVDTGLHGPLLGQGKKLAVLLPKLSQGPSGTPHHTLLPLRVGSPTYSTSCPL